MATELPPLIQALLAAARQAQAANAVLHETHGAWVLLAGTDAYKIKKPVKLPFMDFSTLALRRAACLAELTVNRRFEQPPPQPPLYTEVLPIVGTPDAPSWGKPRQDDDVAMEYAVHMRRFDDALTLDRLCTPAHGHSSSPSHRTLDVTGPTLTARHLTKFAADLARIQRQAAVATPDMPFGHPAKVLAQAQATVLALQPVGLPAPLQADLTWLADWMQQTHHRLAPLMAQRLKSGWVREGHGDLHLGNLALIDNRVQAFDAIEFNDQFRWIDVASDLAFTWMDLLHHRQPGLANVLLSAWLDATGDADATDLLPFYAVYRAMVRAQVTGIRLAQLGAGPGSHAQQDATPTACLTDLHRHIQLARQLAAPSRPALVITHGLSGSGKTWQSSRWLQADTTDRAIRLRSDIERRHANACHGQPGGAGPPDQYAPATRNAVYHHMAQRAAHLLQAGWHVLVDATFLHQAQRSAFAAVARQAGCPFHILACEAAPDTLRARIRQRQVAGNDASDATLAVLEQQLQTVEPLTATERTLQISLPA